MRRLMSFCAALALLSGCGIEGAIKRNDDRYMRPGALDSPLTGIYETYQYRFLDKYRITQQWVHTSSSCGFGGIERPDIRAGVRSLFYDTRDIYEEGGKTWLRSRTQGGQPEDFDRFVRSVKKQIPIYAPPTKEEVDASNKAMQETIERSRKTGIAHNVPDSGRKPIRYEEKETGFRALCDETWQVTSHFLTGFLYKRDLASWRAIWTERNPKGKWSERRVGANVWLVQETAEQDFKPRNGVGGPFQTWLLPIGDTGYTLALELGANQESLKYPDAHARFQAAYRHLIESVKIEPLRP